MNYFIYFTVQRRLKQILYRVNSLYVHPKNSNHLRSKQIRSGKQIIPKQNNSVAHLYTTLVFYKVNWTARNIILCYKCRLYKTIVLGGSQLTCCSFQVAFLCQKGGQKKKEKKIRLDFFVFDKFTCLLYKILPTNLVASKPAFRTFYTSHLLNNKNGSDEKCSQCACF